MPTFFFSAGEPSGDLHAAELIAKLREKSPDAKIVGYGGPKMQEVGCELFRDLTQLAIMWFGRAIKNFLTFKKIVDDADAYFASHQVDAVILVDYPGMNWWIARRAKKHGIPVFYFMPPQIWSWATWRIKKMKRYVDYVLCCLPFEKRWFEGHGCNVEYIGHPFFEEVRNRTPDTTFLDQLRTPIPSGERLLAILPGSRNQEVHGNFDDMLSAAEMVRKEYPGTRLVVAAFKDSQKDWIEERLRERKIATDTISVYVGKTPEIIQAADCCIAVSGSVSLELLANGCPAVIYYRIGRFGHLVQQFFRRSRYITLVNLLAADREDPASVFYTEYPIPAEPSAADKERMLFPEFLANRDRSGDVAKIVLDWFRDATTLPKRREALASLLHHVDQGESTVDHAADYLLTQTVNERVLKTVEGIGHRA
ncbi:MAG: lipid-A-disaccharide synthase [Planctomycetaceae bacterium]|nr:lipid-A-disaccharide synthase [Planctomycetaceae bacterium]